MKHEDIDNLTKPGQFKASPVESFYQLLKSLVECGIFDLNEAYIKMRAILEEQPENTKQLKQLDEAYKHLKSK